MVKAALDQSVSIHTDAEGNQRVFVAIKYIGNSGMVWPECDINGVITCEHMDKLTEATKRQVQQEFDKARRRGKPLANDFYRESVKA